MDDSISRSAVIDALKDMYRAAEKWGEKASDDVIKARAESCLASLIEMKLRIEKMPSAERKRGRWEVAIGYDQNKKVMCTECRLMSYEPTPFCPNCGVEMRGEEG